MDPWRKLNGEIARTRNTDSWVSAADRFEIILGELLNRLPRPPWWRPLRRYFFERDKAYTLACVHYGWPGWHESALKLGVDKQILTSTALLAGVRIPEHRPRGYPSRRDLML